MTNAATVTATSSRTPSAAIRDFRRVATRYDRLARNFLSAAAIATLVAFWL